MERTGTRDDARAEFAKLGLSGADLSSVQLAALRACVDQAMQKSGLMKGTFRCRQRFANVEDQRGRKWPYLQCRAFYFDNREAVTFNPDGFVGFAGWADDQHIQPIIDGFFRWLEIMNANRRVAA